ncbi:hypothetical protein B0T11DRAFT_83178 [Plectosphaerella cucumerina]|uniref:Uncharacterized protein n=1 Tax=Plectosphaerella cucumerina TaxID=40658 RepID=A0A8K0TEC1_9PEZI|nr:hypothetical protein B0T11DRAFT_83178 [Plectosphaerella cucumerina]
MKPRELLARIISDIRGHQSNWFTKRSGRRRAQCNHQPSAGPGTPSECKDASFFPAARRWTTSSPGQQSLRHLNTTTNAQRRRECWPGARVRSSGHTDGPEENFSTLPFRLIQQDNPLFWHGPPHFISGNCPGHALLTHPWVTPLRNVSASFQTSGVEPCNCTGLHRWAARVQRPRGALWRVAGRPFRPPANATAASVGVRDLAC